MLGVEVEAEGGLSFIRLSPFHGFGYSGVPLYEESTLRVLRSIRAKCLTNNSTMYLYVALSRLDEVQSGRMG